MSIEQPFKLSVDYDDEFALHLAESRDLEIESGRVTAISYQDLMQRLAKQVRQSKQQQLPSFKDLP